MDMTLALLLRNTFTKVNTMRLHKRLEIFKMFTDSDIVWRKESNQPFSKK